jgi:hypothetical protein
MRKFAWKRGLVLVLSLLVGRQNEEVDGNGKNIVPEILSIEETEFKLLTESLAFVL